MNQRITMKTVAQHAGVTQATVSLCLANNTRIPPETRRRIREVADRLGYRPNPYVSALMRFRRQGRERQNKPVIALINALEAQAAWRKISSATVRQMRLGAIERAADRGYRAEEFWLHEQNMSPARLSDILLARGIHGVVLGPLSVGAPAPALKWEHFAAVRLGVPLADLSLPCVCNDHFFSSMQAMRECWNLGYRRPGLVMLASHLVRFQGRWNGGLLVTESLLPGIMPVTPLLLESWDELAPLNGWLRREKPDLVISPSATEILAYLRARRWKIPGELGLASLACLSLGDSCSGVYQNGWLIGATGMDTVISMMERNEHGLPAQAPTVMIEGMWNPGKTLRKSPPPESAD
jgi:DNA-binding LacI/PurR family transcriptional regulator